MSFISLVPVTLFLFYSLIGVSQATFKVTESDIALSPVPNNATFIHVPTYTNIINHDFLIQNISNSNQKITIRKNIIKLNTVSNNDKAFVYFCFSKCNPPEINNDSIVLIPSETIFLETHFNDATIPGSSKTSYRISNSNNASESMLIYMNYTGVVSIEEIKKEIQIVSDLYPIPCSEKINLDIYSIKNSDNNRITLFDFSGKKVWSRNQSFESGINTLILETANIESGIYFITIQSGQSVITQKLLINH